MNISEKGPMAGFGSGAVKQKISSNSTDFSERLKSAISDVNKAQHISDDSIEKVVKGELGIHEGMMAMGKADLSLRYLMQVRTKVMDAYREIMRMQF